jgi:hypothetical protein
MLVLMLWTQKFEFGKLVAGVAYDMKGRETVANDLIKREMAREVTADELAELNAKVQSLAPVSTEAKDDADDQADDKVDGVEPKNADKGGKK